MLSNHLLQINIDTLSKVQIAVWLSNFVFYENTCHIICPLIYGSNLTSVYNKQIKQFFHPRCGIAVHKNFPTF